MLYTREKGICRLFSLATQRSSWENCNNHSVTDKSLHRASVYITHLLSVEFDGKLSEKKNIDRHSYIYLTDIEATEA